MKRKIFINSLRFIAVIALFVFALSQGGFELVKNLINGNLVEQTLINNIKSLSIPGVVGFLLLCVLHALFIEIPAFAVPFLSASAFGFWYGVLICLIGFIVGNTLLYVLNKKFGLLNEVTCFDCAKIKKCKNSKIMLMFAIVNPGIPYYEVSRYLTSKKFIPYAIKTTLLALPQIVVYALIGALLIDFNILAWLIGIVLFTVFAIVFRILRRQFRKSYEKTVTEKAVEYTSDTVIKKQNPVLYFIFKHALKVFVKLKVRFSAKVEAEIKGPAIVLCSHGSFTDFLYCAMLLNEYKPYFIVARMYFYHSKLAWLIKKLGCFPKSMFSADIENVKNCMKVLQNGGVLNMMPEARLSTVGSFEGIQPTTYKFIKKMGVPVYGLKINGSFFSNPKWGDGIRKKSKVEATLSLIASKEEMQDITEEDLKKRITQTISYNDFEWVKNTPDAIYKSKTLAEGLENVLFTCPHCKKQFTIKTKGRKIYCTHCGFNRELDQKYYFTEQTPFKHFGEWYEYQKQIVKQEVLLTQNYSYSDNVILKHRSYDGKTILRTAGEGVCTLTKDGLTYVGSDDGEMVEKSFKLKVIYRLLFGAGENFEVYDGKQIYYFVPPDTRSCVKWYILSEILNESEN